MILKIGNENGFEYIQTKGNVKIKSFNVINVLNTIASELENNHWEKTDSKFIKQIINSLFNNWKKLNPEKDEKLFDKEGSLSGRITHTVASTAGIIKPVNIERLIEDMLNGYGYHSNIVVAEYTNDEYNGASQALVMYNHYCSYLLNDEGKTIDIIR